MAWKRNMSTNKLTEVADEIRLAVDVRKAKLETLKDAIEAIEELQTMSGLK